jgi:5-methylcytosine-specific restriction enzyme subunit McrC
LRVGDDSGFTEKQRISLERFYGQKGVPYYSLIHKGVKFNEFVGIIQIGNLTIQVLPKADKNNDKLQWKKVLLNMLKVAGTFDIHAPTSSSLNLKSNSILDLYLELFVHEVEYLLHIGLVKKYNIVEGNQKSLKGNIIFGKDIALNQVHRERVYTRHTSYSKEHPLNRIIYKAIKVLSQINTDAKLKTRIDFLLLNFPEMSDITVTNSTFYKIHYTRKTEPYKKAIEIAHLLLLNYHPDISFGKNNLLAIMFDMNLVWEEFIYQCLKLKCPPNYHIRSKPRKYFWQRDGGKKMAMIPDILVEVQNESTPNTHIILDTKWKNIKQNNPSPEDLRQMYVYSKYFKNAKTALIYPGEDSAANLGKYFNEEINDQHSDVTVSIITLNVILEIEEWKKYIAKRIFESNLF